MFHGMMTEINERVMMSSNRNIHKEHRTKNRKILPKRGMWQIPFAYLNKEPKGRKLKNMMQLAYKAAQLEP